MPYAERDGLRLYFERDGSGDPELLFVPGWCCDHTFYAPQFDHFKRAHAVTALALRGCGRSGSPADGYDIPSLADDIAWFCAKVGIDKPVVIGHSLGGMICIELGARHPSLPCALVADDPGPVHPTDLASRLYPGFAEQLAGPTGEDVRRAWVVESVGPTADDELRKKIVDTMCSVPLPIARAVIEGVARWNGVGALMMCVRHRRAARSSTWFAQCLVPPTEETGVSNTANTHHAAAIKRDGKPEGSGVGLRSPRCARSWRSPARAPRADGNGRRRRSSQSAHRA